MPCLTIMQVKLCLVMKIFGMPGLQVETPGTYGNFCLRYNFAGSNESCGGTIILTIMIKWAH